MTLNVAQQLLGYVFAGATPPTLPSTIATAVGTSGYGSVVVTWQNDPQGVSNSAPLSFSSQTPTQRTVVTGIDIEVDTLPTVATNIPAQGVSASFNIPAGLLVLQWT